MMSELTTRLLLVRNGGRCAVCYRELLVSGTTWKDVYLGERAHIVGRSRSERSPRGQYDLDIDKRDEPDNLIMLCGTCHDDLDHADNLDVYTVQRLRQIKSAHENRIRQILSVPPGMETTVVRLQGNVGDSKVVMDRSVAASTVLDSGRVARFDLSHDITGIEIDLRNIPDPDPGNAEYYRSCRTAIDRVVDRQLSPAVDEGLVRHLSVFGLARWPLLVYLGVRVGDKVATDIYQRHRSTESWAWPSTTTTVNFHWELHNDVVAEDAVLILSLSAAVHANEVPGPLSDSPMYRITPADGSTPHYDIVGNTETLKNAERALRGVLADIEHHRKQTRRLHVLGAAPVSVCIALGRALTRGVHPRLILYDRLDNTYQQAMEIN